MIYKHKNVKYRTHQLWANNPCYEGETLEKVLEKAENEKEPIKAIGSPIYTKRSDGVIAAYNIRTDRFDIAMEAMGHVSKATDTLFLEKRGEEWYHKKASKGETEPVETVEGPAPSKME